MSILDMSPLIVVGIILLVGFWIHYSAWRTYPAQDEEETREK